MLDKSFHAVATIFRQVCPREIPSRKDTHIVLPMRRPERAGTLIQSQVWRLTGLVGIVMVQLHVSA